MEGTLLRLRRYYVLVLVFITPVFAVANAYGAGLTDFDMSSIYGTVRAACLLSLHGLSSTAMPHIWCMLRSLGCPCMSNLPSGPAMCTSLAACVTKYRLLKLQSET